MPEVEIVGTYAEKAIVHLLTRVKEEANFRHYMLGTESLRLCLKADAERRGLPPEEIENISSLDAPPAAAAEAFQPHVVVYRRRCQAVQECIGRFLSQGRIDEATFSELYDLVNGF